MKRSLALPVATLILGALAVSFCHQPSAVRYANKIKHGARYSAANAVWIAHGE
jgi:hypothetical protein